MSAKAGSQVATATAAPVPRVISDDGQTVVFESTATDLVPGFVDHNGDAPTCSGATSSAGTTTLVDGAGARARPTRPTPAGRGSRA